MWFAPPLPFAIQADPANIAGSLVPAAGDVIALVGGQRVEGDIGFALARTWEYGTARENSGKRMRVTSLLKQGLDYGALDGSVVRLPENQGGATAMKAEKLLLFLLALVIVLIFGTLATHQCKG